MARFLSFAALLLSAHFSETKVKTWLGDSDIFNPANWIPSQDCEGVIFGEANSAPVIIENLTTSQLILPETGGLRFIHQSTIVFDEKKTQCIKLRNLDYIYWNDHENWSNEEYNPAVPHLDRVPCFNDDVIFPKLIHTRILNEEGSPIYVKSVKMFNKWLSRRELANFMSTEIGQLFLIDPSDNKYTRLVSNPNAKCENPKGCQCREQSMACVPRNYDNEINCLMPLKPVNFCHVICGASFIFRGSLPFRMKDLQIKLSEYQSYTHIGWINEEMVQVVFTEKYFEGKSLVEARDFQKWFNFTGVLLESGNKYDGTGGAGNVILLIFGTLLAVLATFASLYYYHQRPEQIDILMGRLRQTRGGSLFFARFDNTEEQLVIEGRSMAGSVLDLGRSFENPMFGRQPSPSTSTSTLENPLYDVNLPKDADDEEHEE